jgi:tetratricopeptide (TPR) repeat protein
MMARSLTRSLALLGVLAAPAASAQDIDQAIQAYNADKYTEAAFLFYDVLQGTPDADSRVKAEYYLAHALFRAGYVTPAFQFYGEVFNAGESHPYFLKATEGLLNVADAIDDDILIPGLINKGYSQAFSRLKPEELNAINYMIGMLSERRGEFAEAAQFLEAVQEASPFYVKAQYLLAIMGVKTATEQGAEDYSTAIKHFQVLEKKLAGATGDEEKKLYRLALLGQARAFYSQGDYPKSTEYYERVPRFSDDWYDAMYESGWAYFQNAQFGKALGMVHSIQSPYFDERYRAESFVLKATVYFQQCHFDRGRRTLDDFFALYEPMAEALKPLLEGDQAPTEVVDMVVKGDPRLPSEIRLQVQNNRRFQKSLAQIRGTERELERARTEFPEGNFKGQLLGVLMDQVEQRTALTAQLVRDLIRRESIFLEDFLNQARIIKFETADAERKILELGKDITKGPRAKGPRPIVPNDRFQYWAFLGEYWIDEMGFYEHSIKDECLPDLFGGE